MTAALRRRTGFEIELLAPVGSSRRTLAELLADRCGGRIRPVWHRDSEPSLVPGLGQFLHLTQGFEVLRPAGDPLCRLVDDVTLVTDLDPRAGPVPGWHRLLTDDVRLLRLLERHTDPASGLEFALDRMAALWGLAPEQHGSAHRLTAAGRTIALAVPQGGERERACEVVTPPLAVDHARALEELLGPARALGFTVPAEAATHLHLDGAPFRRPAALANVVRLFGWWREPLHHALGTNPRCRRLAPLPPALVRLAAGAPSETELRDAAWEGGLTKFFDVNLTQLLTDDPVRDTLEVRILPGTLLGAEALAGAALVEALLERCLDPTPLPMPPADPGEARRALSRLPLAQASDRLTAR